MTRSYTHDLADEEKTPIDDWLLEKSGKALESLAQLVDFIRDDEGVAPSSRPVVIGQIADAASNVAKIMSSASGASNWTIDDASILVEHGTAGYRYLAAKYRGRGDGYTLGWQDYWERLEQLIETGYTARSQIYQLTRLTLTKDSRFPTIGDAVELLMMGDLSWEDFVELARATGGS